MRVLYKILVIEYKGSKSNSIVLKGKFAIMVVQYRNCTVTKLSRDVDKRHFTLKTSFIPRLIFRKYNCRQAKAEYFTNLVKTIGAHPGKA